MSQKIKARFSQFLMGGIVLGAMTLMFIDFHHKKVARQYAQQAHARKYNPGSNRKVGELSAAWGRHDRGIASVAVPNKVIEKRAKPRIISRAVRNLKRSVY